MRKTALFALALIGLVALGFVAVKNRKVGASPTEEGASEATAIPVTVLAASAREIVERVEVTGTLKAANEVTVGSRQPGRVKAVLVKQGQRVKRLQPLIRFEDDDQQIAVRSAEAGLAAANARVQQARAMARQQRTSAGSGVTNAQAALSAANTRLDQARKARDTQVAVLDAAVNSAHAAVRAALARESIVRAGARSQERDMAVNAVALAQANYDNDNRSYERYKTLNEQGAVSKAQVDGAETRMRVSEQQLNNAKQQLALVREGPRQEDITAAEAVVTQASEGLSSAQANRTQALVAADTNVSVAEKGVEQADAALKSAQASADVLLKDENANDKPLARDENLRVAETAVLQAKEILALANQNTGYATVVSPVDGVVSERLVDIGSVVAANLALMRLSTDQALTLEAQVSELQATKLERNQSVEITVDALDGNNSDLYRSGKAAVIMGTVEEVVPVVDARSRNFTVRIVVPKTKDLYPGMFARGQVVVARYPNAVTVPKDALVTRDDGRIVFVAEGDLAKARPVQLGVTQGDEVQVLQAGVLPGDRIIITGQNSLKGGEKLIATERKVADAVKK